MSWYPPAVRKPIPPGGNDPAITPIGVILHVAVSNVDSLFDYFNGPSGGIESHFYVRATGPGGVATCEQYRSTGVEADANYKANSFMQDGIRKGFISIETAGLEHGEWNPAQLATIKALLTWLSVEHGFPLRVCPGPYAPGVGYHTLYPPWSNVPGKTCPGPDRIRQFDRVLVPWMAGAPNPPKDDPVTEDDIAAIAKAVLTTPLIPNDNGPAPRGIAGTLADLEHTQDVMRAELAAALAKLDQLLAAGP